TKKDGEKEGLEKWNTNLLQLWRRLELWADGLSLFSPEVKVDCIGQMSKNMYFTTITSEGGRNFCCPRESCWNNSITLALIHFQSKCALHCLAGRGGSAANPAGPEEEAA
uniref:Uncharacterized protein n=1 Tax=Anolis carolinensis TaxID=28377 RepID=A0A803T4A4_ANOCA